MLELLQWVLFYVKIMSQRVLFYVGIVAASFIYCENLRRGFCLNM